MIKNFFIRLFKIIRLSRIRKYGIRLMIYDILILLCHRNNSWFEHIVIRKKDEIVNAYMRKHYDYIINKWYPSPKKLNP